MKTGLLQHELQQTSGIFGRRKDVRVVFAGSQARTSGSVVQLPALPMDAEISEEGAMIVRGYLDHEAGHVRHTDNEFIMSENKKMNAAGQQVRRRLANALEDVWLERRVIREYPGSQKNLRAVSRAVNNSYLRKVENGEIDPSFTADPAKVVAVALTWEGRKDYGDPSYEECLATLPDEIRSKLPGWIAEIGDTGGTRENLALADKIWKAIGSPLEEPEEDEDDDGDEEGDTGTGRGPRTHAEFRPEDLEEGLGIVYDGSEFDNTGVPYRPMTTAYDQWHHRLNEDCGYFSVMDATTPEEYIAALARMTGLVAVMRRRLERALMAQMNRDWTFAKEDGRLDSKRFNGVIAGRSNVFKMRSDMPEMDTAVSVLVDLSGSMSGHKALVARDCAIALAEALDKTGVAYEITGFMNTGTRLHNNAAENKRLHDQFIADYGHAKERIKRPSGVRYSRINPLHMFCFKAYEERLFNAKPVLGNLNRFVAGDNADAEAVLSVWDHLRRRSEQRKVLMVLSDGSPSTSSFDSGDVQSDYLKQVIKTIEANGVTTLGIGICDDSVRSYYPRNLVVENVDELATSSIDEIARLLLGRAVSTATIRA